MGGGDGDGLYLDESGGTFLPVQAVRCVVNIRTEERERDTGKKNRNITLFEVIGSWTIKFQFIALSLAACVFSLTFQSNKVADFSFIEKQKYAHKQRGRDFLNPRARPCVVQFIHYGRCFRTNLFSDMALRGFTPTHRRTFQLPPSY